MMMKKNFNIVVSVAAGLMVAGIVSYGCRKNETARVRMDQETILFEDKTDKTSFSAADLFLGGSVRKVSQVSYEHSLLDPLKIIDAWKQILKKEKPELENIKRTYVHHTDVSLLTIPVRGEGKIRDYFNVYIKGSTVLITRLSEIEGPDGITTYKVQSPDRQLYYQFELNSRRQIGNWKFEREIPKVFAQPETGEQAARELEDCSKKKFNKCMNCLIIDVCGSDWICSIACGLAIPSCVGGAALACLIS
jgi:hypothetical protein